MLSPRVTVHIDDGRSFIRRTNRTYDLIVYALVDSLVRPGHASTPGYHDPQYPFYGRIVDV